MEGGLIDWKCFLLLLLIPLREQDKLEREETAYLQFLLVGEAWKAKEGFRLRLMGCLAHLFVSSQISPGLAPDWKSTHMVTTLSKLRIRPFTVHHMV